MQTIWEKYNYPKPSKELRNEIRRDMLIVAIFGFFIGIGSYTLALLL